VFAALSPTLGAGQVRITLTWVGPDDLDAHLQLPDRNRFIHFDDPGDCDSGIPTPCLRNDDFVPPGPETMIIGQQQVPGQYTFLVHNFDADAENRPPSDLALAQSGARVDVYLGAATTPSATFFVPNQPGNLWTVFNLNGTTISPVNTIGHANMAGPPSSAGGSARKKQ
jgi:hypothetical protein